jgi:alanine-synthesizing transaminase
VTLNGLSKSIPSAASAAGWMCFSGAVERGEDVLDGVVQLAAMRLCSNALTQVVIRRARRRGDRARWFIPGGRLFEQREAAASVLEDRRRRFR